MTLTAQLVPTYAHMLKALAGWMEKAQAALSADQARALLLARLAPDMFPLSTQIRFACVQAHEATCRLRGTDLPDTLEALLDEGRKAGEHPGTIDDALARIHETIALLDSLSPHALDMAPDTPIAHRLSNGMIFDLTAEQYARDWTLPQFYFHLMTAYAILRAQGIALGKADYIPHLLPHLRPDSLPAG